MIYEIPPSPPESEDDEHAGHAAAALNNNDAPPVSSDDSFSDSSFSSGEEDDDEEEDPDFDIEEEVEMDGEGRYRPIGAAARGQQRQLQQQQPLEEDDEPEYDYENDSFSGTDSGMTSNGRDGSTPRSTPSVGLSDLLDPDFEPDELEARQRAAEHELGVQVQALFNHSVRLSRAAGDGQLVYERQDCPPGIKVMQLVQRQDHDKYVNVVFYTPQTAAAAATAGTSSLYVLSSSVMQLIREVISVGTNMAPMSDHYVRAAMRSWGSVAGENGEGGGVFLTPQLVAWLRSVKLVANTTSMIAAWPVDEVRAFLLRRFPAGKANARVRRMFGSLPGERIIIRISGQSL